MIADSTGDTAARVARAAQAQFSRRTGRIVRHPRVTTAHGLADALDRVAAATGGVAVFSTLVDDGLRALVGQRCEQLGIPHCDLLGPALAAMEIASGEQAERVPARPVSRETDYFKRIAAMEFAIKHDDGQVPAGLRQADIVLVGVSRTGKTPLSMYLGYLGYKTANIPLVPDIEPPPELFEIDRSRIVALTIDPERLLDIRSRRVVSIGGHGDGGGYAGLAAILAEIDQADRVCRRLGCPVIDTSTIALEEAAGRVIDLVDDRRGATRRP